MEFELQFSSLCQKLLKSDIPYSIFEFLAATHSLLYYDLCSCLEFAMFIFSYEKYNKLEQANQFYFPKLVKLQVCGLVPPNFPLSPHFENFATQNGLLLKKLPISLFLYFTIIVINLFFCNQRFFSFICAKFGIGDNRPNLIKLN